MRADTWEINSLPEAPFLFDWTDKNGPADKIEPRIVSVDILKSIAVVRLDVDGWSGNLAGSGVYMFSRESRLGTCVSSRKIRATTFLPEADNSSAASQLLY